MTNINANCLVGFDEVYTFKGGFIFNKKNKAVGSYSEIPPDDKGPIYCARCQKQIGWGEQIWQDTNPFCIECRNINRSVFIARTIDSALRGTKTDMPFAQLMNHDYPSFDFDFLYLAIFALPILFVFDNGQI